MLSAQDSTVRCIASLKGFGRLPLSLRTNPAQAFWLKKNLGGMGPVSKICDNEDSTTTLGDSHVLRIQHPVGPPIAELAQRPKEGTKVPSSIGTEDARDVFPEEPRNSEMIGDGEVGEHEVATGVVKSLAQSCDGEGLTGRPSDKKVN
jgi:hypothetical protein